MVMMMMIAVVVVASTTTTTTHHAHTTHHLYTQRSTSLLAGTHPLHFSLRESERREWVDITLKRLLSLSLSLSLTPLLYAHLGRRANKREREREREKREREQTILISLYSLLLEREGESRGWLLLPTLKQACCFWQRNLRSTVRWFTGICNSHYISRFAAVFIVVGAKISIVKSCIVLLYCYTYAFCCFFYYDYYYY
jgi:hypothetical protein